MWLYTIELCICYWKTNYNEWNNIFNILSAPGAASIIKKVLYFTDYRFTDYFENKKYLLSDNNVIQENMTIVSSTMKVEHQKFYDIFSYNDL